ncbi:ATP synthase F0 subunit B [Salidesulfovibrio brasiliensis]|uniref:ATP synthase F0 subunit B n=1 Tax=Salidesulfovibrio brasiliensis TaxID=221711 RepID=UPI0006D2429D|nr:ATP synthase F0 subunit B [Salidesulfovibrio brasiliensis]
MIDFTLQGILIQLVNFLITLVGLNILLFRPIREIIKQRRDLMAGQMDKIETFSSQAESKLKGYEEQLQAARQEGNEVRNKLRDEGVAEEQKLLSVAGEEASQTLKAARTEIDGQVKTAMEALAKDIETYANKATDKILGQA